MESAAYKLIGWSGVVVISMTPSSVSLNTDTTVANRSCGFSLFGFTLFEPSCRGQTKDVHVLDMKGYGFVSFVELQDAFRFLEVSLFVFFTVLRCR
jgi:hypothetical protein